MHRRAAPQPATDEVGDELRSLFDKIRTARLSVVASAMPEKAARLTALIAELEHRITGLIALGPDDTPSQVMTHAPVQAVGKPPVPDPLEIKPIPLHLAVVPSAG